MQYQLVTAANLHQQINQSDHKFCQTSRLLVQDLGAFLQKNAACQCSIVQLNVNNAGKKNVMMIRGKLSVNLPEAQRQRPLGFKFVLPQNYPQNAPLVYLDEPENKDVIDMIDYLEPGNRIMFKFIYDWDKASQQILSGQETQYTLLSLLGKVYNLFCKQPPISFEELFGADANIPAFQRQASIDQVYKQAQQSEQINNDLDNFDPLAELDQNLQNLNNENMDAHERKSVWKMNYKMKNEHQQKQQKINLIDGHIQPKVKEIVVDNMWQFRKGQINDLCTEIDKFEESHHEINDELKQLKGHNDLLTDNIPEIDKQIELLKQKLDEVNTEEITADKLMDEIFKPQSIIDQRILKYQCKEEAFQGTMLGYKMINEINDLPGWLKTIREVSNKQFKSVYKKNKLINYKQGLQHGNQQQVPGMMHVGGYQQAQYNQNAYQL